MKVSKNYKRGRKITSLDELYDLAVEGKAVWFRSWGIKSARVMTNQQVWWLKKAMLNDQLWTIVKI